MRVDVKLCWQQLQQKPAQGLQPFFSSYVYLPKFCQNVTHIFSTTKTVTFPVPYGTNGVMVKIQHYSFKCSAVGRPGIIYNYLI